MLNIMKKFTRNFLGAIVLLSLCIGCAKFSMLSFKKKEVSKVQTPLVKNVKNTPEAISEANKKMALKREHINNFCKVLDKKFYKYGWGKSRCSQYLWKTVRNSNKGQPLIWTVFQGDYESEAKRETTMIMCGVHGDEITPVKFCFDILHYLTDIALGKIKDPHTGKLANFKNKRIVLVPLVSPDSFFKKWPTRTNAKGIDINRNFPTKDFTKDALRLWKSRYRKDKRRYPGQKAMSEPEVVFQVNLIKRYSPDKIISVHAPLTMLDYDGPADRHTGGIIGSRANQLLIQMSENAKGYKIKNYPFFPGSLGNYAGNERNIPTYTLELPSSDNRKHRKFWKLFKNSMHSALMHDMSKEIDVAIKSNIDKKNPN